MAIIKTVEYDAIVATVEQQCIADMCPLCAKGWTPIRDSEGDWIHDDSLASPCLSDHIHERIYKEKGGD